MLETASILTQWYASTLPSECSHRYIYPRPKRPEIRYALCPPRLYAPIRPLHTQRAHADMHYEKIHLSTIVIILNCDVLNTLHNSFSLREDNACHTERNWKIPSRVTVMWDTG